MFCPKCGKELLEGAKFCGSCGAHMLVEEAAPVEEVAPVEEAPKKKKSKKGCIIGGILTAIVAVIAAIAVLIVALVGGFVGVPWIMSLFGDDISYAYLSNGSYNLVTDIDSDETIRFASTKSGYTPYSAAQFSPDGEYLYYFTKFDSYSYTGTLHRAKYDKLTDNMSKNNKYIQTIASDVYHTYYFVGDNSIVYHAYDGALYLFDGEESLMLAENVGHYFADTDGRVVYTVSNNDGETYTLYGYRVGESDTPHLIAENVNYLASGVNRSFAEFDLSTVYFSRYNDSITNLYATGFDAVVGTELLLGEASDYNIVDNKLYTLSNSGKTVSLYDYVNDDMKDADAAAKKPAIEDYATPYFTYKMVSGNNLKENNFTELYTSCTKKLYFFGESTYFCYSMETALSVDWGENNAEAHEAIQAFINKHGKSADKDGYIKVTADVKADLLAIQAVMGDAGKTWQWMWLCYDRYQDGNAIDYDAYYAAQDDYADISWRNSLRESLQDKENAVSVRTLSVYDGTTLTPVAENILDYTWMSGGFVYNTIDMITDKINMSEISHISDMETLFKVDTAAQNHVYLTESGTACTFSADAAASLEAFEASNYASFLFDDATVYLNANDTMYTAAISGNSIGAFNLFSEDAKALGVYDGVLYYVKGLYTDDSESRCGDLYKYENGESALLATDINVTNGIMVYEDNVYLSFGAYNYETDDYELMLFDEKGNRTTFNNIDDFVRLNDSTYLYISGGDLYRFDGKEHHLIDRYVEWMWYSESMNFKTIYN